MSQDISEKFGPIRSFLWPIYSHELTKVIPMLLMFFCIVFDYNILKNVKDTLMLTTAKQHGAGAVLFIKTWGVLPIAILSTLAYIKMSSILSKKALFYATILPFLIFFIIFAFFIHPNREILSPVASAEYLSSVFPSGFQGIVAIYRHWTASLFFICSELWSGLILNMLFWNFANEITSVKDAKRFYPIYNLGSVLALLCSGLTGRYVAQSGKVPVIDQQVQANINDLMNIQWEASIRQLMLVITAGGLFFIGLYYFMQRYVIKHEEDAIPSSAPKKEKVKLSIKESLQIVFTSKYIGCIALIVFAYNFCINIVEVTWKDQVNLYFASNPNDYSLFTSNCQMITAATNFVFLLASSYVLRKFGWNFTAMSTPIILLITSVTFFLLVIFYSYFGPAFLGLAVIFGAAQNILSKASKYSFFDSTKEMAYIPLDQELRVKGKAAVDVVGSRLGKSTSSLIQQVLLIWFGTLGAIAMYTGPIMLVVMIGWIWAVKVLGKEFRILTKYQSEMKEEI